MTGWYRGPETPQAVGASVHAPIYDFFKKKIEVKRQSF
jgi:hypothetical protein